MKESVILYHGNQERHVPSIHFNEALELHRQGFSVHQAATLDLYPESYVANVNGDSSKYKKFRPTAELARYIGESFGLVYGWNPEEWDKPHAIEYEGPEDFLHYYFEIIERTDGTIALFLKFQKILGSRLACVLHKPQDFQI